MDLGLQGRGALVASSSRGLGYATALGLAKEGCNVVINGRDEAKLKEAASRIEKETGARVSGIAGDVSDASVPERLVSEAAKFLGGIDLLVTNAGGPPLARSSHSTRPVGQGGQPVVSQPRAPDTRGAALPEEIQSGERADHDILHSQTAACPT